MHLRFLFQNFWFLLIFTQRKKKNMTHHLHRLEVYDEVFFSPVNLSADIYKQRVKRTPWALTGRIISIERLLYLF
jgi:hypothetical protein